MNTQNQTTTTEHIQRAWCRVKNMDPDSPCKIPTLKQVRENMGHNFRALTIQKAQLLLSIGIYMALDLGPWGGASDPHGFLVANLGVSDRTAYEWCGVAEKLIQYDYLSDTFIKARISYSKVRKVLQYITRENEHELVDLAQELTYQGLEERLAGREKNSEPSTEESFNVTVIPETGQVRISGVLSPAHGAKLLAALKIGELAQLRDITTEEAEEIFQEAEDETGDAPPHTSDSAGGVPDEETQSAATEDGNCYDYEPHEAHSTGRTKITIDDILMGHEERLAKKQAIESGEISEEDKKKAVTRFGKCSSKLQLQALLGILDIVRSQPRSSVQAPGAEITVLLTQDCRFYIPEQMGADPRQLMELVINSALNVQWTDENGNPFALMRKRRLVSPKQAKALLAQWNHRCAMPGCTHTKFIQFHHIKDWQNGGETNVDNLIPLCSGCHALVTEGLVKIYVDKDNPKLLRFEDVHGECFTSVGRTAPILNRNLPYKYRPNPAPPRCTPTRRTFKPGEEISFDDDPEPANV